VFATISPAECHLLAAWSLADAQDFLGRCQAHVIIVRSAAAHHPDWPEFLDKVGQQQTNLIVFSQGSGVQQLPSTNGRFALAHGPEQLAALLEQHFSRRDHPSLEDPSAQQERDRQSSCTLAPERLAALSRELFRLTPGTNLRAFLDEAVQAVRAVAGASMVQIELSSPQMRACSPARSSLPPTLTSLSQSALDAFSSAQTRTGPDTWGVALALTTPSHCFGTLTATYCSPNGPDPGMLPLLQLAACCVVRGLENTLLSIEQERSLDEMQALADIGRMMLTSFDLDHVLDLIAHTAVRFIPTATRAVIHLPNDTRDVLIPRAQAGMPDSSASLKLPWGIGIAGRVAVDKAPIYVPDTAASSDFVQGNTEVGSLMVAPLLLGEAVIGTISVSSQSSDAFTAQDLRILVSLASQAAVAIENARLHDEARKADEIAALYELSQAVNRSLDLQETITTILSSARSLTYASSAEVRLVSPDESTLESVVALGNRPDSGPGDRYRLSVFYPRMIMANRQPLLVEDTHHFEHDDDFCRHEPPTWVRSYLGLPLIAGQRLVGILSLGSQRAGAFSAEDIRVLQIVAGQAATALSNARLYEEATLRLREAQALARVSHAVATNLNQAVVLDSVLTTAVEALPLSRHSFAFVVGPDGLPRLAGSAPSQTQEYRELDRSIWEWAADGCLLSAEPLVIDDTLKHGFPADDPAAAHSIVAVPMIAAGKVVGVLGVDSTAPNAFVGRDLALLQAFAAQAATGLENSRLFTDLNAAYRDLAQSTETLTAVFNGITDGMYIVDNNDTITMINQPEAEFLNGSPKALLGQSFRSLYHRDDSNCEHCTVLEALRTGKHQSSVVVYSDQNGEPIWREIDAYPIRNREGLPDRAVVFARDVTARRRMEASLYESSKLASIGQLAASVAHEINNPLTVIIGNTEILLLDLPGDSPHRERIEMMLRAAQRAARIVQNLQDFSSQQEYEFCEVEVRSNLEDAIELVAHPLRRAQIQLSLSVDDGLPPLWASPNHLKMVWMNILLNAKDAIEAAGRDNGLIKVEARLADAGMVAVSISDNGTGIRDEDREYLFQPFHASRTRSRGLGLGLYNVYTIVEKHEGKIEVNTKLGQGSSFTIYLPTTTESVAPRRA